MKTFALALLFCAASAAAQGSRIELRSFHSAALGIVKPFNVYLPQGYDTSTERYPVIYLFRGHEREWANPVEDGSRQGRTVKDDADALAASGAMGNVILVMPGMSSADNAVATCGVNMLAPDSLPAANRAGIGTGRFEEYLVRDLIPYVDSAFRTIPTRWARAVDGFSLGGQTSMMFAAKYPELFCSAGAFDGTLMWLDFTNPSQPGTLNDLWVRNGMFDALFNKPRDIPYMLQYNASNIVRDASSARVSALRQMQFLLRATPGGNDDRTNAFVSQLAAQGIVNGFADVLLTPDAQHNWFHADMYAMQTFPLHWKKFQAPIPSLYSPLAGPAPSSTVSGVVPLAWLRGTAAGARTLLQVSADGGAAWRTLHYSASSDSVYHWDTRSMPDGTRYMLRLYVMADSSIGVSRSAGRFTVNNPGNAAPDIELLVPAARDTVSEQVSVRWNAADADGDSVRISIDFSADNGASWKTLASSLPNTGVYVWNSTREVNAPACLLRLRCSDGAASSEVPSAVFTVKNKRYPLFPYIVHRYGGGDGSVTVVRVDNVPVVTTPYRLQFDDTDSSATYYTVTHDQAQVVPRTRIVNNEEGPYFDGFRLIISNYSTPRPLPDSIRWIRGTSDITGTVLLPELIVPSGILKGVPYASDYVITIADKVADTSVAFLDAAALPMKFFVWNRTKNRPTDVLFDDVDGDGSIGPNDVVFITELDGNGERRLSWQVAFAANDVHVKPAPGDRFLIKIAKPFTREDVFDFTPTICDVETRPEGPRSWRLDQNYPNPFNPSTMICFSIPRAETVRLTVFDALGREVSRLLNERLQPGTHTVEWNARNAASGFYFCRLTAGAFSETKKLVLTR